MKELSLNILDVTKNSVSAGATCISITLDTDADGWLTLSISDNGCGMSEEVRERVSDPFYTTRTTRKVGMGLPLLKMAAEQTGGGMEIVSSTDAQDHGTTVRARFDTKSIDFTPVGDIASTVSILIMGSPEIRFIFSDKDAHGEVALDTAELVGVLGEGVSLSEPWVIEWIEGYLKEQYENRQQSN